METKADKKIFSMFGLAARAGKIASGEFQTETAVKSQTAYLVVVAEDASDNTKKLFHDKCSPFNRLLLPVSRNKYYIERSFIFNLSLKLY